MSSNALYRDKSIDRLQAAADPPEVLQYTDDALLKVEGAEVQSTDVSAGGHLTHHLDGKLDPVVFDLLIVVLSRGG